MAKETKVIERKEIVVSVPALKTPAFMQGFMDFIREQGVVGLAVGFVLGAQVKVLVDSLVASFINPLLGLVLPGQGSLSDRVFVLTIGSKQAAFTWGVFVFQLITFVIVAAVVYMIVHKLKLDKLDKKKS